MKDKNQKMSVNKLADLIGGKDEVFGTIQKEADRVEHINNVGRNSGIKYVNKYSVISGTSKLANSDVVDVSSYKGYGSTANNNVDDLAESVKDVKPEPQTNVQTKDDDDFDKFFDEFMSELGEIKKEQNSEKEEPVVEEPKIEVKEKKKEVQRATPKKKKRNIDIDIISGGVGGDII